MTTTTPTTTPTMMTCVSPFCRSPSAAARGQRDAHIGPVLTFSFFAADSRAQDDDEKKETKKDDSDDDDDDDDDVRAPPRRPSSVFMPNAAPIQPLTAVCCLRAG
eukprot:608898-Prymnesium_polylepis.1